MTTARELMRPCPTVAETTTVSDLVQQLANESCSALAVVNGQGLLIGIVTEFDLVRLIYESGDYNMDTTLFGGLPGYLGYTPEQLKALTAGEIMTNDVETVSPEASLDDVAKALFQHRRKVLLVAKDKKVLGAIHRLDMVRRVLG